MSANGGIIDGSQEHTLACVGRWLTIKNRWSSSQVTTGADVDHSALLRRLLVGDEPLDKPPPCRFSYPDYTLGGGGSVEVLEAGYADGGVFVVDQSVYRVVERRTGAMLLEWPVSGERFELRGKTLQKVSA